MRNVASEGIEVLLGVFIAAAILITYAGGSIAGMAGIFGRLFVVSVIAALLINAYNTDW